MSHVSNVLGINEHIPTNLSREILQPVFPINWELGHRTLANIIHRCRIYKSIHSSEKPKLQANMKTEGYIELIGMSQKSLIDRSLMMCDDVLVEAFKKEDQYWVVQNLMEGLKSMDDGFDYRISKDIIDRPCGVVWVTSSMRFNYEKYGFCIFLDAMKRDLNDLKWPYISVVILDTYGKVRCCCEALVASEKLMLISEYHVLLCYL